MLVEATPEPVLGALGAAEALALGEADAVVEVAEGDAEGEAVGEPVLVVAEAVGLPPAGVWAEAVPPPQKKAPKPSVIAATAESSSISGIRLFSSVRFIPLSIPILFLLVR